MLDSVYERAVFVSIFPSHMRRLKDEIRYTDRGLLGLMLHFAVFKVFFQKYHLLMRTNKRRTIFAKKLKHCLHMPKVTVISFQTKS